MSSPRALPGVPRFSWAARFATRQRLKSSLWFVPLVCAVAGPLLARLAITLDSSVDLPGAWRYSEETASAVLSAIVSAMVRFCAWNAPSASPPARRRLISGSQHERPAWIQLKPIGEYRPPLEMIRKTQHCDFGDPVEINLAHRPPAQRSHPVS